MKKIIISSNIGDDPNNQLVEVEQLTLKIKVVKCCYEIINLQMVSESLLNEENYCLYVNGNIGHFLSVLLYMIDIGHRWQQNELKPSSLTRVLRLKCRLCQSDFHSSRPFVSSSLKIAGSVWAHCLYKWWCQCVKNCVPGPIWLEMTNWSSWQHMAFHTFNGAGQLGTFTGICCQSSE